MGKLEKIKVLVVDDSLFFRKFLFMAISMEEDIEVVSTAEDPQDAVEKLMIYRPDVILCDIEMPKMNGIGFISRLAPKYPIPIIVISGHEGYKEEALQAGAFAFVSKPKAKTSEDIQRFITYIIEIIRNATVFGEKNPPVDENKERKRIYSKDIIAIGASTGGTQAIFHILRNLDTDLPGIVIVQHIPERFSKMFAERLNEATAFQVKEARSGDTINKGCAYIAPGNRHMKVNRRGDEYSILCFDGGKVNGHRPSIDVLFASVAKAAGNRAIGVLLTGMGTDGAEGLLAIKQNGGKTIGQDQKSSVVYGMPKEAYLLGAVDYQISLENISKAINRLAKDQDVSDLE
jgi:two-component system chemotaxis response regulator CheB